MQQVSSQMPVSNGLQGLPHMVRCELRSSTARARQTAITQRTTEWLGRERPLPYTAPRLYVQQPPLSLSSAMHSARLAPFLGSLSKSWVPHSSPECKPRHTESPTKASCSTSHLSEEQQDPHPSPAPSALQGWAAARAPDHAHFADLLTRHAATLFLRPAALWPSCPRSCCRISHAQRTPPAPAAGLPAAGRWAPKGWPVWRRLLLAQASSPRPPPLPCTRQP